MVKLHRMVLVIPSRIMVLPLRVELPKVQLRRAWKVKEKERVAEKHQLQAKYPKRQPSKD